MQRQAIPGEDDVKTTVSAKASELTRKWYVIDAEGKVLGRLATKAAWLLTGKGKPIYTPHVDCGDHVIVVNAEKVKVTGKKMTDKLYRHHTGYLGSLKEVSLGKMLEEKPEEVIREAVHGMVPKTKLGKQIMTKLKVYRGPEHPHSGQKPETLA
jgi:large subunit ribosomal protein L13